MTVFPMAFPPMRCERCNEPIEGEHVVVYVMDGLGRELEGVAHADISICEAAA